MGIDSSTVLGVCLPPKQATSPVYIYFHSAMLSAICKVETSAIVDSAKMPAREPRGADNEKRNQMRVGSLWRVCSLEDIRKILRWDRSPTALEAEAKALEFEKPFSADRSGNVSPGNEGEACPCVFQLPVHYPRYSKADYELMPEWKLDNLFQQYVLPIRGDLTCKRNYAMGTFLWPDQL